MENLTWYVKIHSLFASLSKIYYIIKSLRNVTSSQMIWSIYFAYFQSRLRYGIVFCGTDILATEKGDSINYQCT